MPKTVLITGGSSGIGFELAKLFARDGYRLVLAAKPADELNAAREQLVALFPRVDVLIYAIDLTLPDAADAVYGWALQRTSHINVLVNCAGFGSYGHVWELDTHRELEMIQLNVLSLYQLNRLALRDMMEIDEGYIINFSSISAFQPNPLIATYGATKSFVLQFSMALNRELQQSGSNVRITVVCPTSTKNTGFQATAGMSATRTFSSWMTVTPDFVAREAYRAMQQRQTMIIPNRFFHLLHKLVKRLPTSWLMAIAQGELKPVKS